jgi:thiol-disulfide isomerase/thioredoxin
VNTKIKLWLKKRWKDLVFFAIIGLLFIPQVRQPVQVFVQQLFAGSPDEIQASEQQQLKEFNWSMRKLSGEAINLSSSKGEVMLINSWATWCPPCIAEMPSLQSLYNDFKDKVDFYFVSNEKSSVLRQWLSDKEYDLPVYQSMGPVPSQLNSSSLPTTYLINRKGNIVMEEVGANDWNSDAFRKKLEIYLKE